MARSSHITVPPRKLILKSKGSCKPGSVKALARSGKVSPSSIQHGKISADVLVLTRKTDGEFETEVSFMSPKRATPQQKLKLVCSVLQNLSKHGGRCDISVQYYDKNGLNDTTDLRNSSYARLNPITWSNNNKIFVSLKHVYNKARYDDRLFVKAWTDREYIANAARQKSDFLMLEDFEPAKDFKHLSDEEQAYVMLRKQYNETNDVSETANAMMLLKDATSPKKGCTNGVKPSVSELQAKLAARNEELNQLLEQNEQLQLEIKRLEQERDDASDAYEAAVQEENDILEAARAKYNDLLQEEKDINEKRETLRKEYIRQMEELEGQFKPRLETVRKQLLQMERNVPKLGHLLSNETPTEPGSPELF